MARIRLSADEKRWRAESDAHTLRQYAEIMSDSARRRAAEAALKKQLKDMEKATQAVKTIIAPSKTKGRRK